MAVFGTGILYFLVLIEYAILFRAILSWFVSPFSSIMKLLIMITEPFVAPFRALSRRFSGNNMMFDFSMTFAILFLWLLRSLLVRLFF